MPWQGFSRSVGEPEGGDHGVTSSSGTSKNPSRPLSWVNGSGFGSRRTNAFSPMYQADPLVSTLSTRSTEPIIPPRSSSLIGGTSAGVFDQTCFKGKRDSLSPMLASTARRGVHQEPTAVLCVPGTVLDIFTAVNDQPGPGLANGKSFHRQHFSLPL